MAPDESWPACSTWAGLAVAWSCKAAGFEHAVVDVSSGLQVMTERGGAPPPGTTQPVPGCRPPEPPHDTRPVSLMNGLAWTGT
jgi:hypothetical protein